MAALWVFLEAEFKNSELSRIMQNRGYFLESKVATGLVCTCGEGGCYFSGTFSFWMS